MLLLNIRDYIQLMGSVNLTDLARHFDLPESVAQDMVEQWVRRGKVLAVIPVELSCSGGCNGCQQLTGCQGHLIKYRWNVEDNC